MGVSHLVLRYTSFIISCMCNIKTGFLLLLLLKACFVLNYLYAHLKIKYLLGQVLEEKMEGKITLEY